MTVSTFVSPHLWLYQNSSGLEVVKGVMVEQPEGKIPEDFARMFKALGDTARLQIIRYLLQGITTTKMLAQEMRLSEAVISKHLRILWEAGLVRKAKKGQYVEYEFKTEMIDYIPYTFYETMM